MKILLSNDDGIMAPGLQVLGEALAEIAEVYVAAPKEEQSAAGHGITVRRPLYAHAYELAFARQAWAVDGLPADCVKLALEELLPFKPDLVVSGINNGANLGNDIIYSGTVSAAMEGFMYGLPALAVSVTERPGNVLAAAAFAREVCQSWGNKNFSPRTLLNINVPGWQEADIKGWRYSSMGWLWYENVFSAGVDAAGHGYYWLGGRRISENNGGNTDVETCTASYISVTPLNFDLTDYRILACLTEEGIL